MVFCEYDGERWCESVYVGENVKGVFGGGWIREMKRTKKQNKKGANAKVHMFFLDSPNGGNSGNTIGSFAVEIYFHRYQRI